jgi:hypothetical protein
MYKVMKKLISKKYYATKAEATDKLDTFYAFGKLTDAQYEELTKLCDEVYGEE